MVKRTTGFEKYKYKEIAYVKPSKFQKEIASMLRETRINLGLSQRDVTTKVKITSFILILFERGYRILEQEKLEKLIAFYDKRYIEVSSKYISSKKKIFKLNEDLIKRKTPLKIERNHFTRRELDAAERKNEDQANI